MMRDPYLYPGTQTLINRFSIKDPERLQELESAYYHIKLNQPVPTGNFDYEHLKAIHFHLFGDVYPWAGKERTIDISKNDSQFGLCHYLGKELNKLFNNLKEEDYLCGLEKSVFCEKLAHYFNEVNAAHPFREGNGRAQRLFCEHLALKAGFSLRWIDADKNDYIEASTAGFKSSDEPMMNLLMKIVHPFNEIILQPEHQEPIPTSYEKLLFKSLTCGSNEKERVKITAKAPHCWSTQS
jgi:cell filamentation protein